MGRQGIQLAVKFEEKRLLKWLDEVGFVFAQPKLNGVRAWWDTNHLISSEGNVIDSVPHVPLRLKELGDWKFDGELYHHGTALQSIRAITGRTVNRHDNYEKITFCVFDIKMDGIQVARLGQLERIFGEHGDTMAVKRVPHIQIYSVETALMYFHKAIDNRYEGIILRHPKAEYKESRSTFMMKWKARQEDTFEILEVLEGQGKYAGTLGALVVCNRDNKTFHVGSFRLNDLQRKDLWDGRDLLPGRYARVRFFELSESGLPPSGVFVRLLDQKLSVRKPD